MFQDLNAATLSTFSEPFVYKKLGGDVSMSGVFTEDYNQENFGTVSAGDKLHRLDVDKAAAELAGVVIRETVNVRGVDYSIIDLQTDLSDMVFLTLRRYS